MSAPSAVVAALRAAGCVFAEDEAELIVAAAATSEERDAMVARRAAGEPLEYVLGWAEFRGLRVALEPGVFVPRRRTEFLVEQALTPAASPDGPALAAGAVLLDLCCGAGALGLAVATERPGVELHAADVDPAAVRCARRNLAGLGTVYQGDLFEPLPPALRGRAGLLLANVPYVPTGDIATLPAEAREHEARAALDGGPDGLDVLRRVAAGAADWLAHGGSLLSEVADHQVSPALAVLSAAGLSPATAHDPDTAATVLIGTRPRP